MTISSPRLSRPGVGPWNLDHTQTAWIDAIYPVRIAVATTTITSVTTTTAEEEEEGKGKGGGWLLVGIFGEQWKREGAKVWGNKYSVGGRRARHGM